MTIAYFTKMDGVLMEFVRVSVFGKFASTNDVKRRRLAIGKRTKVPT